MLPHFDVLSLRRNATKDCLAILGISESQPSYMLKGTQGLLVKLSAINRGPKKVECSRGGADFRNRPEGIVVWKLYQNSI